jgi:hypothetical protein
MLVPEGKLVQFCVNIELIEGVGRSGYGDNIEDI